MHDILYKFDKITLLLYKIYQNKNEKYSYLIIFSTVCPIAFGEGRFRNSKLLQRPYPLKRANGNGNFGMG